MLKIHFHLNASPLDSVKQKQYPSFVLVLHHYPPINWGQKPEKIGLFPPSLLSS